MTQIYSIIVYTKAMRSVIAVKSALSGLGLFLLSAKSVWAQSGVFPLPFCDPPHSYFNEHPAIYTALGCVPSRPEDFIEWLLPYVFGMSGGISFLLMVYGFILLSTSKGDPKAVQGAQETITSAIVGLCISIFALFILRLVAVDILQIPGLTK